MKGFKFVSVLVFVTLFVVALSKKNAGASTSYTEDDAKNLASSIKAHQKEWENSISPAYHAFSVLQSIEGKVPNKDALCKLAKDTLGKSGRVEEIYQAVSIAEGLGCGESVSADVTSTLTKTIANGEDLEELYYAVNSVLLLQDKKHITFNDDFTSVVSKVLALEDEGIFSNAEGDDEGNIYATGLALQLLAKLRPKLPATDKGKVDELKSHLGDIISAAEDGESTFVFQSAYGALKTTSTAIKGITDFADALGKDISADLTAEYVSLVADYFLHFKQSSSAEAAHYFLQGINALNSKNIPHTVVVTLETPTIDVQDKTHVSIRVTDISGKAVPSKVTLTKATNTAAGSQAILSNTDLSETSGQYRIDFVGLAKPDVGFYTLNLKVVPKGTGFSTIEPSKVLKVLGAAVPSDFELAVTDAKDSRILEQARNKVKYPETLKGTPVRVDKLQYLRVSFRVRSKESNKAIIADQAFVRLTNLKTKNEAVFAAVPNVNEDRLYNLAIGMDENAPTFKYESGDYKLELIVGDALINPPFTWEAATVSLNFKNTPSSAKTTPKPESRRTASLPEITHVFASPQPLPTKSISSAFTLAVLSPFLVFLLGLLIVGANFKRLFSTSHFFYGVGFLTCIAANAALIIIYWLRLTMITTLGYLGVLSLPTIFFGNRALANLAWERKEKQKSH
eukprot:TRINITY_DN4831_c0_g1_i1.p1 TRINITY_DN4831_c0_g1~~TRINITY_DN4831_c0_g1_i1.p1  ORF type:complete len:681 (-),score=163.65 TRINITY_DN4831_c0_g1_i1:226-2268(-)